MIIYEHKDYDEYVRLQRRLTRKKTNTGRNTFYWIDENGLSDVNKLLHSYVDDIKTMVCHGCRNGLEVNIFQTLNPNAKVFGTDLYGRAYRYDRTYFREMDFDEVPPEWIGYFDVIYSNSIDHSRDPINTLLAWKSELKDGGICFVNFHWGIGVSREDCFHLDGINYQAEVKEIAEKVGMKVLYTSKEYLHRFGAQYADVVLLRGNHVPKE
jgi:hypothetical protein